jgi:hypothetical protein
MRRTRLSRRQTLQALFAAGAAQAATGFSFTGCGGDDASPSSTGLLNVEKTVHLTLGSEARGMGPLSADIASRLELRVGRTRHPLKAHSEVTRAALRIARGPQFAGDASPTHYVESVRFSAKRVQSVRVVLRTKDGLLVPIASAVHVPSGGDRARAERQGLRSDGGAADPVGREENPAFIIDLDDAAIFAVFHHPSVVSLAPEVADRVVEHISLCASYASLTSTISELFYATTPEQAEEGIVGWINARYAVDGKGNKQPLFNRDGTEQKDEAGKTRYAQTWILDDRVLLLTSQVVKEVNERFNNDETFEGIKYLTLPGASTASPLLKTRSPGIRSGLREEEEAFAFPDGGHEKSRRTLDIESSGANKYTVKITNNCALGSSVLAIERDADGKAVSSRFVGYVQSTFFPSLSFALFGPSTREFEYERKKGTTIDFHTTCLGITGGQSPIGDIPDNGDLAAVFVTLILDVVFDIFLPTILLVAGGEGEASKEIIKEAVEELLKDAGIELLVDVIRTVVIDIVNISAGTPLTWGLIEENIVDILKGLAGAIPTLMLKSGFAMVAAVVLGVEVEKYAEDAIPIFGTIMQAVGAAQTVVQLAIAAEHIVTNQFFTKSTLSPTHEIEVVLVPNAEQSASFPPAAIHCSVTLTPSGKPPTAKSVAFDALSKAVTVAFPSMPIGGNVTVDVALSTGPDVRALVVGKGTKTVNNQTEVGATQEIEIEVTGIAIPVTASTKFAHKNRLVPSATGRTWQDEPRGPTADDSALSCDPKDGKVCVARALTLSQTSGLLAYSFDTPCGDGALSTIVHDVSTTAPVVAIANACGNRGSITVIHGIREAHALVVPVSSGELGVFPYAPGKTNIATFNAASADSSKFGNLLGRSLRHARIHPTSSHLLALTEIGVEILHLEREAGARAASSQLFTRRGERRGCSSGAVAVAPFYGLRQYALLEQGARRLQVFDFAGRPINHFGGKPWLDLRQDDGRTFLDVDIDGGGRPWVLSVSPNGSKEASFNLDIYGADGVLVLGIVGVNAYRIALDIFGDFYTLNTENALGPSGYAEPSLSTWTPSSL